MLGNVGLEHLVTRSVDEYVERAVELAGDLKALSVLRGDLRNRMAASPLAEVRRQLGIKPRETQSYLGHGVLTVNNSVSHIVKDSRLIPGAQTELAPENSRRWAKVCLGNKILTEPVWIANGPESRSTSLEEQDIVVAALQQVSVLSVLSVRQFAT